MVTTTLRDRALLLMRVTTFLCLALAALYIPHVLAHPSGSNNDELEQLNFSPNSDYSAPSLSLPIPPEELLGQQEHQPQNTFIVSEPECKALFDGQTLSIPCLRITGLKPVYKADLSVISNSPAMRFRISDVSEASSPKPGNIKRPAAVESLDIQFMNSFPKQVKVSVKGYLRNSCEHLETQKPKVERFENNKTFKIYLNVNLPPKRPHLVCLDVVTPFEKMLGLDVQNLEPGLYTVDVNGVMGTFDLNTPGNLIINN